MSLDIWFKDDIRNILLGMDIASAHLASQYTASEIEVYRAGFQAALAAAAVSFGIRPSDVVVRVVAAKQRQSLTVPSVRE